MPPLTVYAQKLPSGDVSIYRDKERTNGFCTIQKWRASCPTRRNKWITLNCYRWRLEWLPAIPA